MARYRWAARSYGAELYDSATGETLTLNDEQEQEFLDEIRDTTPEQRQEIMGEWIMRAPAPIDSMTMDKWRREDEAL